MNENLTYNLEIIKKGLRNSDPINGIRKKLLKEAHPDVGGTNEEARAVLEAREPAELDKLHKKRYGYNYGEDNKKKGKVIDTKT